MFGLAWHLFTSQTKKKRSLFCSINWLDSFGPVLNTSNTKTWQLVLINYVLSTLSLKFLHAESLLWDFQLRGRTRSLGKSYHPLSCYEQQTNNSVFLMFLSYFFLLLTYHVYHRGWGFGFCIPTWRDWFVFQMLELLVYLRLIFWNIFLRSFLFRFGDKCKMNKNIQPCLWTKAPFCAFYTCINHTYIPTCYILHCACAR